MTGHQAGGDGYYHPIWTSYKCKASQEAIAVTRARILTGTFVTQTQRNKFIGKDVDPTCQLCLLEGKVQWGRSRPNLLAMPPGRWIHGSLNGQMSGTERDQRTVSENDEGHGCMHG